VRKTNKQTLWGLAAGLLMSCAQAGAANSTTVDLSHFKVELTDLAPSDGIAPAITFAPAGGAYQRQYLVYEDEAWRPSHKDYAELFSYGDHVLTGPHVEVRVSSQPFELAVQVSSPSDNVFAFGSAMWEQKFSLTPHTQALFTVDIDTTQTNDISNTWAVMAVTDQDWTSFNSEARSYEPGTMHRSLTGMVVSMGDERMRTLSLSVFGFLAAPIPEPATYAMLLGGLAVVGWRGRRRQGA